jgi:hypothetical protein
MEAGMVNFREKDGQLKGISARCREIDANHDLFETLVVCRQWLIDDHDHASGPLDNPFHRGADPSSVSRYPAESPPFGMGADYDEISRCVSCPLQDFFERKSGRDSNLAPVQGRQGFSAGIQNLIPYDPLVFRPAHYFRSIVEALYEVSVFAGVGGL